LGSMGQSLPRVDNRQARYANRGGRSEKRVYESEGPQRSIKKPQKQSSCADQRQEPYDDLSFYGQCRVCPGSYRANASPGELDARAVLFQPPVRFTCPGLILRTVDTNAFLAIQYDRMVWKNQSQPSAFVERKGTTSFLQVSQCHQHASSLQFPARTILDLSRAPAKSAFFFRGWFAASPCF